MTYCIEIKIFGKVTNPEAIWALAEAASQESSLGALDGFDPREFEKMLVAAEEAGEPIYLSKEGYDDVFADVTAACRDAGLSYIWTIGDPNAEGPTSGLAWKQGMGRAIPFIIHDNKPGLELAVIARAARKGIDAVNDLVETVSVATTVGKIELEVGFLEAYRSFESADEEAAEDDQEEASLTP
jgi:hypothetical protein